MVVAEAHPARLQRRSSPGRRRAQWILTGWAALGRRREQPAENLEKAAAASKEREVTKGGRVGVTLKVHHPHPCSPQLDMQETWSKQEEQQPSSPGASNSKPVCCRVGCCWGSSAQLYQ